MENTKQVEVMNWLKQHASEVSYNSSIAASAGKQLDVVFNVQGDHYSIPLSVLDEGVPAVKAHLEKQILKGMADKAELHELAAANLRQAIAKGIAWRE
ncbi:MAG TPA: hypothetical protein PLB89_04880 [Flavobacteriales bacterium]|nr:hypothetical protein [Flavobacteriales bacterium]